MGDNCRVSFRRAVVAFVVIAMLPWLCGAIARADEKLVSDAPAPVTKPDAKAAAAESAKTRPDQPVVATVRAAERKLRFQFRFQPWKDVLDWFAQQADLSLVMDAAPPGTFNYSDRHEYTPAEAIDLLNGVLLTKGYTLVRRNRMLMVINLEDGIPANLVPTVAADSLDTRGEFELVSVLFNLHKLKPEEAEAEIRKMLGPQGSVVALAKSQQVLVTETAGRLRAVRTMLGRIEGPDGGAFGGVCSFDLKSTRPGEVLPVLRQLLDIPEDKSAAADGSIRIAIEGDSNRLVVSGRPEKVARVADILRALDVPSSAGGMVGQPQLEVYPIASADPQSALAVVQTMMTGQPDVRLVLDPKTNSLVVMARPAQHATIRATLAQMERDGQRVEVIRLNRVDPQTAQASITKLFAGGEAAKGTAPQVDADLATRQLMIRGTDSQIAQIRGMLTKMGEVLTAGGDGTQHGNVRTLPMGNAAARATLERIQEIWPTLRQNPIRVIGPSDERRDKATGPESKATEPPRTSPTSARQNEGMLGGGAIVYVADQTEAEPSTETPKAPPIVVTPGPSGLVIASEDTEALDEFERLLNMLSDSSLGGRGVTVFYLRHAKAESVTETLSQILTGVAPAASSGSGGGRRGNAGAMFGGPFGSPFGGPFGALGNGAAPSPATASTPATGTARAGLATGTVKITADPRLNALLVQANPTDLATVEQLLKVLDQKESPEDILVASKPRRIAVRNTKAQDVAEIVRQVYADRLVQSATPTDPRAAGRMMMVAAAQAMGRGGQPSSKAEDVARVAIGVDTRTNSLIVVAPDALFEEVRELVEQLDTAAGEGDETVRVVTLHRTSSEAVEQALAAIAGDSVEVNRTNTQQGNAQPNQPGSQNFRRGQYGAQGQTQRTGGSYGNRGSSGRGYGNQGSNPANQRGGRGGGR